jgi:hypothetical protein
MARNDLSTFAGWLWKGFRLKIRRRYRRRPFGPAFRISQHVPQRAVFSDVDEETLFYARSAFTAWEYALVLGRHNLTLWNAIKGSPFECLYRQKFHPQDLPVRATPDSSRKAGPTRQDKGL